MSMVGKKVRCVDNRGNEKILTIGDVYTIAEENTLGMHYKPAYKLAGIGKDHIDFFAYRFEEVDCEAKATIKATITDNDIDEDKLWAQWKAPHPGECACGIAKVDCDYHRPVDTSQWH